MPLLLLLLSRFSRVRLCATPWTAAYQAFLSMGFSSSYPSPLIPMSQFPAPVHALPESHLAPQLYQVPVRTECRSSPLALSLSSLLLQSISKCLQSTGSLSETPRPAASTSPGYLLEMQIIRVPFRLINSGTKFGVGSGQQRMFYQASRWFRYSPVCEDHWTTHFHLLILRNK